MVDKKKLVWLRGESKSRNYVKKIHIIYSLPLPTNVKFPKKQKDRRVPHEVYRRLVNNDGEALEDDTFNENATEILNKQNLQRTQR